MHNPAAPVAELRDGLERPRQRRIGRVGRCPIRRTDRGVDECHNDTPRVHLVHGVLAEPDHRATSADDSAAAAPARPTRLTTNPTTPGTATSTTSNHTATAAAVGQSRLEKNSPHSTCPTNCAPGPPSSAGITYSPIAGI